MRHERLYLQDIVDAADKIASFIKGHDSESFNASALVESAVNYQLAIIGEAASHVSRELRGKHPEIVWGDIIGARNNIVHEYFGTDPDEVWRTVSRDVPVLKSQILLVLHEESSEHAD